MNRNSNFPQNTLLLRRNLYLQVKCSASIYHPKNKMISSLLLTLAIFAYYSEISKGEFVNKLVQKTKSTLTSSPSNSPTLAPVSLIQLSPTIVVTMSVSRIIKGTRAPAPAKNLNALTSAPVPIGTIKFKRDVHKSIFFEQKLKNGVDPSSMSSMEIPSTAQSAILTPLSPSTNTPPSTKISLLSEMQTTRKPSAKPSSRSIPTLKPSLRPSVKVSSKRSAGPSISPSSTSQITQPAFGPSMRPSLVISSIQSRSPSSASTVTQPINRSAIPSPSVSLNPKPTYAPSAASPTTKPSVFPFAKPSTSPIRSPTAKPSAIPSLKPSKSPPVSASAKPSAVPSAKPSKSPPVSASAKPSVPVLVPNTRAPSLSPAPSSPTSNFAYHGGGQVLSGTVHLYNIYLGRFDSANTSALVNYFAQHIGSTDWFQILSAFRQQNINAAQNATFAGSAVIQPTAVGLSINDSYIQNALSNLFRTGALPLESNGIYTVMFRGDFKYPGWNSPYESKSFCSFHTTFTVSSVTVKLAVVGDPTTSSPVNSYCLAYQYRKYSPTANNDPAADSIVTNYAHQLVGVITDYSGTAWYKDSDGEKEDAGDLCNFDFGESRSNKNMKVGSKYFLIQKIYSPSLGSCTLTSKRVPSAAPTLAPTKEKRLENGRNIRRYPTFSPFSQPTLSPSEMLSSSITYHRGFVLGTSYTLNVYNIYLGAFSDSTMDLMDYLGAQIGSSKWYNILTAYYYYDPKYGQRQYVTNGTSFGGRATLLPDEKGLTMTVDDIVSLLYATLMDPHSDLIMDSGGVYEVMFRGDFNVSFNGGYWLQDWCSFHSSFELPTGDVIKFAVLGDPATATSASSTMSCVPFSSGDGTDAGTTLTPNNDLGADSMAVSYTGQLAQSVTDYDGAWYADLNGLEVSSLCTGDYGSNVALANVTANVKVGKKRFLLQSLFHPKRGCTLGKRNPNRNSGDTDDDDEEEEDENNDE